MILTKLKRPSTTENTISTFGGINKKPVIPENCFFDTQNTSSRLYPVLSSREKRIVLDSFTEQPKALYADNGLSVVLGSSFYYNGVLQYDNLSDTPKKQIVSMGAYLIVFPDGYYINTNTVGENGVCSEKGNLSKTTSVVTLSVKIIPCLSDRIPLVSTTSPPSPVDKMLWLNNSQTPEKLLMYSENAQDWISISPTHIGISYNKIGTGFFAGDCILISGVSSDFDGSYIVTKSDTDFLIVRGSIENHINVSPSVEYPFVIKRTVPVMDFICEHQNRLFGCRYGTNENGDFVNEVYASKLGDPKNWNYFPGLSTDSYIASCGSHGKWTGITSHLGYVFFFKENCIHRLFGTKPSNFNIYTDECPGVKSGSEKSICKHEGKLLYHSENGIYAYSGNRSYFVSDFLCDERYSNAVAGLCNNIYYICMTDKDKKRHLFAYDIEKNILHREDFSDFLFLSSINSNALGIKNNGDDYSMILLQSSNVPEICQQIYADTMEKESVFEWYAESGKIGIAVDDCKFVGKLKLCFEGETGSSVTVFIQIDSNQSWEYCGSFTSVNPTPASFEIIPPRCNHFKIKITGKGSCKIYSLTKVIEKTSGVIR